MFVAKKRANGSPEAVQILFSKIHNYMISPTASFWHPKHAGEKLLGGGSACKCPEKKAAVDFFFGTRHFGALENFCQALSGG